MSAHVLLNLLNELGNILSLPAMSLINSIIQDLSRAQMLDSIYQMTLRLL